MLVVLAMFISACNFHEPRLSLGSRFSCGAW